MKTFICICFALLLLADISFGQPFTPVEYRFSDTLMVNQFGFGAGTAPATDHFTYSAANGYGNWCVTNTGKWLLMGNYLGDSSSIQTSGEVAKGDLGFVDPFGDTDSLLNYKDIKVASNLVGDVRYVWPLTTNTFTSRTSFIIKGFSEKIIDTVHPILNIGFNGFPKPSFNSKVIKGSGIQQYKTVSTNNSKVLMARDSSMIEQFWQNMFDVALDGRYMYLTWQVQEPAPTNRYRIMYAVIDLTNDSIVISPRLINGLGGRRPTIACNVRNNENVSNPSPEFDIVYISSIPFLGEAALGNEVVRHFSYFDNTTHDLALTRSYQNPNNPSVNPKPTYTKPLHARMIVASYRDTLSQHPSVPKGVYVLADDGDNLQEFGNLFFHPIEYPNIQIPSILPFAYYVDGSMISARPYPLTNGFYEVVNNPIVAFANPYDGQKNSLYDEFHCVYIVNIYHDTIQNEPTALHIIRGYNNSYNTGSSNDKRFVLNKHSGTGVLTPSPEHPPFVGEYTASVNQMGLFVNWYNYTHRSRYYQRDVRRFDEDIEENTLATGHCVVADGESHGGVKNVSLVANRKLTLWSEPRFIGHDSDNTHRRGKLLFEGSGVSLNIGYQSDTTSSSTVLTTLPNHEIVFSSSPADSHRIVINEKSYLHHYGYPINTSTIDLPNISGAGKIILNENNHTAKGGNLIVHGGAILNIPDKVMLELRENSTLTFKMEQSVYPPLPTTDTTLQDQATGLNLPASGRLWLHGTFISNGANVVGDYPEATTVIEVKDPIGSGVGLPATQFSAYATSFIGGNCDSCGYDHGLWGMRIAWTSPNIAPTYQFRKIAITNCHFQGASLSIANPSQQVLIDSSWFSRTLEAPISLNWLRSTNGYGNIFITNNSIELEPNYYGSPHSIPSGIQLTGFRQKREDGIEKITISDNYLISDGENPGPSIFQAAIFLQNTSALVLRNYVYGAGFNNGIVNKFTPPPGSSSDRSNTMFCSNHISGCENGAGLLTENWKGHARMNIVEECLVGHQSEEYDEGGIMYSRYSNNYRAGLSLKIPDTEIDLRGIHTSVDKPAFDTINHNNTLGCDSCGQIITNGSNLLIGTTLRDSVSLATYGHNTFIMSDSDQYIIRNLSFNDLLYPSYHSNFWGIGSWASVQPILRVDTLSVRYLELVDFRWDDTLVTLPKIPFTNPDTPVCGVWYDWGANTHSSQQPQSISIDTEYCRWLEERVDRNDQSGLHQIVVDTGKLFIEQCANYYQAWRAFNNISYSLDFLKYDTNRYINHVQWLKSVLYLNTEDSLYWCADVRAILVTFHYTGNRSKADGLGALAIMKYVKEQGKCLESGFMIDYEEDYRFYMDYVIQTWRDTVTDSIATPLDTTLPSLEDLDLEILRGKSGVVAGGAVSNAPRLATVTAERNPFTDEVALKVELTASTMLRLDIYDELGRSLYGKGLGYKQKGEHRFSLSGKAWADGVYYARISTSGGEVRTVKLIKQ